jgi:deazaflavin-dependent oxidoreductase (nitroreductase family)
MEPYQTYRPERRGNIFVRTGQGGRILSASMLPWFTLLPPTDWGVLATTGRKTGKVRRKCVRAIRAGDEVFIVALRRSAWLRNLQADPHVHVRVRGGTFAGVARVASGDDRARLTATYCQTVVPFDYVGCLMHRRGWPTRSKGLALHRQWCELGMPVIVRLAT